MTAAALQTPGSVQKHRQEIPQQPVGRQLHPCSPGRSGGSRDPPKTLRQPQSRAGEAGRRLGLSGGREILLKILESPTAEQGMLEGDWDSVGDRDPPKTPGEPQSRAGDAGRRLGLCGKLRLGQAPGRTCAERS